MDSLLIVFIVIAILLVLIFMGAPIFLALGTAGMTGLFLTGGVRSLAYIPMVIYSHLDSFILLAVPLFLMLGQVLAKTDVGPDIYTAASKWLYRLPGGLSIASIMACAIFGAMSGVSIAGAAAIGAVAIPEMTKRGYAPSLAAGSVAAAGALAMLIPPSLLFILYGLVADVSVGKLFIGGIIPGIILALMMSIQVILTVLKNPKFAPMLREKVSWKKRFVSLSKVWPTLIVIFGVLGTIYLGVATPTEAGAIGTGTAILLVILVYRKFSWNVFSTILNATARSTCAILLIYINAIIFTSFLSKIGAPEALTSFMISLDVPNWVTIVIAMFVVFILGMFVDGATVVMVTAPLLLPIMLKMGYSPLWFGIILIINLEMAVITPPVGLNLYAIKSVTQNVPMKEILRGALPFVIVEILCLILFIVFPEFALWLPGTMQ